MKVACFQHLQHPKCRPGKTSTGTKPLQLRSNGRWGKDNGDPGLAFIGIAADATDAISATVWVAHCKCKEYRKCPVSKALMRAPDEARGRRIDRVRRIPRRRKRR